MFIHKGIPGYVVSAKTGVASDTKYRELKDSAKKDQCKVHRNGIVTVIDVDDVVVGDVVGSESGMAFEPYFCLESSTSLSFSP